MPRTVFIDLPVAASFEVAGAFDGVIVTDRFAPQESFDRAIQALGSQRVLAPSLLGIVRSQVAA